MEAGVVELIGNKAIEDAAIRWVIALEQAAGRQAQDVRYTGSAADVMSPCNQVKAAGRSCRGNDLSLETRQVEEAEANPYFYIYVVENVRQGDPANFTLRVLGCADLHHLLARKRDSTTSPCRGLSASMTPHRSAFADETRQNVGVLDDSPRPSRDTDAAQRLSVLTREPRPLE